MCPIYHTPDINYTVVNFWPDFFNYLPCSIFKYTLTKVDVAIVSQQSAAVVKLNYSSLAYQQCQHHRVSTFGQHDGYKLLCSFICIDL